MLPAWGMPIAEYNANISNTVAAAQEQIRFALAVIGSALSKSTKVCQGNNYVRFWPNPAARPDIAGCQAGKATDCRDRLLSTYCVEKLVGKNDAARLVPEIKYKLYLLKLS
jgi:hypothetical protein